MHHGHQEDELLSALRYAQSTSWAVRAAAGRRLAAWPEHAEALPALHRLLLDERDTGVTQETAEALLKRQDLPGLRAVLRALSQAESVDNSDHLDAEVSCDPRWSTDDGAAQLIAQLSVLARDGDPGVRSEALHFLGSTPAQYDARPAD
ncbi:HEAT repeat domain-containing protein [Actinacidiphila glaucinigra]|uniref:HEAT repeat domain-containing protein n=1 Tax=Actinacidiphila glaucinigra TaxID=235986 RepID=UPI00366C0ED8